MKEARVWDLGFGEEESGASAEKEVAGTSSDFFGVNTPWSML